MSTSRTWLMIGAVLLSAAGIYGMGTNVGSAQWIVALVMVVLGVAALVYLLATRGRGAGRA